MGWTMGTGLASHGDGSVGTSHGDGSFGMFLKKHAKRTVPVACANRTVPMAYFLLSVSFSAWVQPVYFIIEALSILVILRLKSLGWEPIFSAKCLL